MRYACNRVYYIKTYRSRNVELVMGTCSHMVVDSNIYFDVACDYGCLLHEREETPS